MNEILYLDTARLGQVSPSASLAINDALRLNKAFGASMYLDDLLKFGHESLPKEIVKNYLGLTSWNGIERLKREVAEFVFPTCDAKTLIASRTASLVRLGVKMLFARCRNVLVTDLIWPAYRRILADALPNDASQITMVKVKEQILSGELDVEGLVDLVTDAYTSNGCDGIFLPAICNFGIKLPVEKLVNRIASKSTIRFSIVDAAQAVNHVELVGLSKLVDFTIAGSHKWLRSYAPLAFGLFAKKGSASFIATSIDQHVNSAFDCDPLLKFSEGVQCPFGETLNLSGLFGCSGAVKDAIIESDFDDLHETREVIREIARSANWEAVEPKPEFCSRILMIRKPGFCEDSREKLRRLFIRNQVAVSDFAGGYCRISIPDAIGKEDYRLLRTAFACI